MASLARDCDLPLQITRVGGIKSTDRRNRRNTVLHVLISGGKVNRVLIAHDVIEQIQSSCRKCAPSEAGGLLLGYRKGIDFEVIAATLPNQWDRASSTRFVRSVRGHRIRALREWKKSQGSVDWIGEWHSHPHGALRPSYIDLTNWKKLRTQTGKEMVFAIVGFNDLGLWLQSRPLGRAVHLDLKLGDDAGSLFEVKK